MMNIPNTPLATIRTETSNRQAAANTAEFIQDLMTAEILPSESEYLAVDLENNHRPREDVMRKAMARVKETLEEKVKTNLIYSRSTNVTVRDFNKTTNKLYTSP